MKTRYTILAIDTSCDETSAAVTLNNRVLSNAISSQVEFHREYGGVVPFLAKRMHEQLITPAILTSLAQSRFVKSVGDVDAIAVTVGPGLAPALEIGIAKAKQLSLEFQKPLIAVNHMESHLVSSFALNRNGNGPFANTPLLFPILALLVSGGHTQLVLMNGPGQYILLGETLDDAAGEAFDKVAKMLDLGYPGGSIISELAKKGQPNYRLPVPMVQSGSLNFSFSGLKTACLYFLQKQKRPFSRRFTIDFAASFERVMAKALVLKLTKAIEQYHPRQILLGGGVISNLTLRKEARKIAKRHGLPLLVPYSKRLFTDNAAMVGVCAWYQAKRGDFVKDIARLERQPNLGFGNDENL
ncbi:MAG: tRNA (adenosine(37)-N6)-threonylcarbamoyltransferase complex transferase subunit TsaD [Candidatus Chisholmbacteria bacterium RIFCSPLOWO2_01_FULL_50_28]|uniref:tRNA N6-adenosine threonylcarbamoyltransferase n=1 Tax=Candidatus Chisholmbacteria bacterium RIFCSPHIGHO2_01_FULL_52_32 TaxID=1797591 RepID=A0A1G1VTD6_9BACT|nr:MAG: tRNA (adenosine(37)-N6)-threonylcarbamoyltransferase complex transferase subunit TsaD [Candidatus Chisholmbacteria bacterium RIFCSPHIGHO2_01_FULL_52_32]OGY19965.1 MAG: tRNA (adenosine(37)-N6)-threonylcarbamoyltransferase complex transferase subunit TsaD [Candidatus Chisholmbacteria bacterium RIFCSPLOWO2_01_FULL_50_28]